LLGKNAAETQSDTLCRAIFPDIYRISIATIPMNGEYIKKIHVRTKQTVTLFQ